MQQFANAKIIKKVYGRTGRQVLMALLKKRLSISPKTPGGLWPRIQVGCRSVYYFHHDKEFVYVQRYGDDAFVKVII